MAPAKSDRAEIGCYTFDMAKSSDCRRCRRWSAQTSAVSIALLIALTGGTAFCATSPAVNDRPPFPVAHDAPLKVVERRVEEHDDHSVYRVEFNGIKGDRVPAFVYTPKNASTPRPAILLQYGSGGNK